MKKIPQNLKGIVAGKGFMYSERSPDGTIYVLDRRKWYLRIWRHIRRFGDLMFKLEMSRREASKLAKGK